MICKYFLPFCGLSFHFLINILWCMKVWNFDQAQFFFVSYTFNVIFKNPLCNPRSWRFTPLFSSKSFIIFALTFRSFNYFELNFVKGGECRCFLPSLPLSLHIHEAEAAQSCPTLCNPGNCSPLGSSIVGFSRQEYWSGLPFPNRLRTVETILWKILSQQTSSGPSARIVWGPSPSQQLFSSSSEIIRMSKSPTCGP